MTIKIDRSRFKKMAKERYGDGSRQHAGEAVDFSDDVITTAQEYLDSNAWLDDPEIDSKRAARIAMQRYVRNNLDLSDEKRSWFLPSFIWIFLARQVIMFIVMAILDLYWVQMATEKGLGDD
jgi:hypothetical protein